MLQCLHPHITYRNALRAIQISVHFFTKPSCKKFRSATEPSHKKHALKGGPYLQKQVEQDQLNSILQTFFWMEGGDTAHILLMCGTIWLGTPQNIKELDFSLAENIRWRLKKSTWLGGWVGDSFIQGIVPIGGNTMTAPYYHARSIVTLLDLYP